MDWLWGAALLPLLACGAMCIGGMALAAVGLRRGSGHRHGGSGPDEVASRPEPDDRVRPAP